MIEILLGAIAEAIMSVLVEDLAQRTKIANLRTRLSGDSPEKLAVQRALEKAYKAFTQKYRNLSNSFFDEHYLQQSQVIAELSKILTPDRFPNKTALAQYWEAQFISKPNIDLEKPLSYFLDEFEKEVKSEPSLKSFIDSRAFQQLYKISAENQEQTTIQKEIRDLLRKNLELQELEIKRSQSPIELPASHVLQNSNIIHLIWNSLEPDLQDALSLAYNQANRDGRNVIKTRYFFAAIARLRPEPLPELLALIPQNALPTPISEQITMEKLILEANPQLSGCVNDSLTHFDSKITPQHKLSSADMFVDLVKYGTGSSVAQLRRHKVFPETIDEIVDRLGWDVLER